MSIINKYMARINGVFLGLCTRSIKKGENGIFPKSLLNMMLQPSFSLLRGDTNTVKFIFFGKQHTSRASCANFKSREIQIKMLIALVFLIKETAGGHEELVGEARVGGEGVLLDS